MIEKLCFEIGIPSEAAAELEKAYGAVYTDAEFQRAQEICFPSSGAAMTQVKNVSARAGIAAETVCGALVLSLVPRYRALCRLIGIPESIGAETLHDIRAKVTECHTRRGVWGINVGTLDWNIRILTGRIIKLGRLEYEQAKWGTEGQPDYGTLLRRTERVWKIHIPSGESFSPDAVQASLRMAYDYFDAAELPNQLLPLSCASWLLSPYLAELLPPESNILSFAARFDRYYVREENKDAWRIFGVEPNEAVDNVPEDTTLRRKLAERLRQGGTLGFARGVMLFDGEKEIWK